MKLEICGVRYPGVDVLAVTVFGVLIDVEVSHGCRRIGSRTPARAGTRVVVVVMVMVVPVFVSMIVVVVDMIGIHCWPSTILLGLR